MPTARRASPLAAVTVAALLSLAGSQPAAPWAGPGTGSAPPGQRHAPTPPAAPTPGPEPSSPSSVVNLDFDMYDTGEPGVLGPDDIGVPE